VTGGNIHLRTPIQVGLPRPTQLGASFQQDEVVASLLLQSEAAFWSPAFLLPRPGVAWSAVDSDTARVTVAHRSLRQTLDIRVAATGQPMWVSMPRWSNANAEKTYRIQPFGGDLSDFRKVSGYRLPFHVDGGNFFGTADYFAFYKARVVDVRFADVKDDPPK
jgi:hypothetical protein